MMCFKGLKPFQFSLKRNGKSYSHLKRAYKIDLSPGLWFFFVFCFLFLFKKEFDLEIVMTMD